MKDTDRGCTVCSMGCADKRGCMLRLPAGNGRLAAGATVNAVCNMILQPLTDQLRELEVKVQAAAAAQPHNEKLMTCRLAAHLRAYWEYRQLQPRVEDAVRSMAG